MFFFVLSCKEFKQNKIELNYKEGYVKILSNNYVIDSLKIYNHLDTYYLIGLNNKNEGSNIIFFNKPNNDYNIYKDSLEYYCSQEILKKDLSGLEIIIRRKGFYYSYEESENIDIVFANYNKIPCNSILIDTILTISPYK